MLLDEGLIVRHGGRWEPARDLSSVVLPPSIEALLAARLDRLAPGELVVLQRASVIGRIFGWGAVTYLSPEPERATLAEALQGLLRKEVVFMDAQLLSGEDAYRFGHILIRDAAYRGLPKETRADLHERFATFLADSTGDRVAEYEEIIGYHLEQAFRFRMELGPLNEVAADVRTRASSRLESAGQRALYRGDLPAALNLYQRAAALAEGIANHAELQTRVGGVLLQLGQFAEAEALFELARDTSREDGDERWAAHAEVGLEFVLLQTDPDGRASEIVELTERLVPLFRSAGDDLGLARTWRLRSEVGRIACRYGEKAALLEQALPYAQTAGEEREAAEIKLGLGNCFCWGPMPVKPAIERCQAMLDEARGVRWVEASILGMLAYLLALADSSDDARRHWLRSRAIFEELGMSFALAARAVIPAGIERMAGELEAAERELRLGHDQLEAIGEKELRSTVAATLAHVLHEQGRDDEAEEFARACADAAAAEDIGSQVLWRSALAKIVARRDHDTAAELLADEAVRLAATTDMLSLHGTAVLDRARVAALLNTDGAAPPELIVEAQALFRSKGDAASLRRLELELVGAEASASRA
jgi:tetratricopeptide (TPR) repeat protein